MGILGFFSSKVLAAGYGVVFSEVMFVLVAKTVKFFLRKSKAVSSGGTKTKLEERECGRWRGKVWDGSEGSREFFSARLMVLYMMGEKWVAWLGMCLSPNFLIRLA